MEHMYINSKGCTRSQLSVLIRDLNNNTVYQGFRIKIKNRDWVYTTISEENGNETNCVIFDNLTPETVYEFVGEIKINGQWVTLQQTAFITQTRKGAVGIPLPPRLNENCGGALRRGD
jgi:hypothetical protein